MIEPTITIDAAARTRWPIVIIGAGPAGSATASALAREGIDVLLVDRASFPREKVCGCCTNHTALGALDRLGIDLSPALAHAPRLDRLMIRHAGRTAALAVDHGVSISRGNLDAALIHDAIDNGAQFLPGTAARVKGASPHARTIHFRGPGTDTRLDADIVVVSDGLSGTALDDAPGMSWTISKRSRMGVAAILPPSAASIVPGAVEMRCARHGYVGLVRLADGRIDLAGAIDPRWMKTIGGPGPASSRILDRAGGAPVSLDDADWMGAGLLTRRRASVAGERLFALGDAAGYVEPFTGEGIGWALLSAEAVTPILRSVVREGWRADLAHRWTHWHRRSLARRQRACRLIAAALRQPMLMHASMILLARRPTLARPIINRIEHPGTGHGNLLTAGAGGVP